MEQNSHNPKLSPQQDRAVMLERKGDIYYGKCRVRIDGPLEPARLLSCIAELIRRHSILDQVLEKELLVSSESLHWLTICVPLIAADSVSFHNMITELVRLYQGETVSSEYLQYAQFTTWQHELLEMPDEAGTNFWRAVDWPALAISPFPFSKEAAEGNYRPELLHTETGARLAAQIQFFCDSRSCDQQLFFGACLAVLLNRYTGGSAHFGYVLNDRDYAPLQSAIGLIARTLPISLPVQAKTFSELLEEIIELHKDFLTWKEVFNPVTENAPTDSLHPSYAIGFEYLDCRSSASSMQEITFTVEELYFINEPFIVKLFVQRSEASINFDWYFDPLRLPAQAMEIIQDQFLALVNAILKDPDAEAASYNMLSPEGTSLILDSFSFSGPDTAPSALVPLFKRQALALSFRPAIVCGEKVLTYKQLDEGSAQLAQFLVRQQGVRPGDFIGLLMPRSEWLIIAMLGIFKARCSFIPIDTGYPAERIQFIVSDSGTSLILTMDMQQASLCGSARCLPLPERSADIKGMPADDLDYSYSPDEAAYVIYTSGSTGQPKGVKVGVGSLVNYLSWANKYYFDNAAGKPFACFTPLSFDLTLTSILSPLLRGDQIIISEEPDIAESLTAVFREGSDVRTVKLTPSHISLLNNCGIRSTQVEIAIVGGEALTREQVRTLKRLNPGIRVYNEYGPTEATIGCVVKEIKDENEKITIGKPIDNTRIYIVDGSLKLQPAGIIGEICIAGAALAHGYLGRLGSAGDKFIEDPFRPGSLMYRTGDAGRWMHDGEIDYTGRLDRQLKIRGYRIEPGEIEEALLLFDGIDQAVVITGSADRSSLLAYYTGPAMPDADDLVSFLKRRLPEYMIPSVFIRLRDFPLTPNGKVDMSALPDPDIDAGQRQQYHAPSNLLEWQLAAIWEEVLEKDRIGIHDNFFAIGGHSLKAIRIISRIFKELQVKVPLKGFLTYPAISGLAGLITTLEKKNYLTIPRLAQGTSYPLSFAQRRLWVLDQLDGQNGSYNMVIAYTLHGHLHLDALRSAIQSVVARHESLRTNFIVIDGEPAQIIHNPSDFLFDLEYFESATEEGDANAAGRLQHWAEENAAQPFDLRTDPLIRVKVARVSEDQHVFLLTMHHIVSDGWSLRVLMKEIRQLYGNYCGISRHILPGLTIHYKDYAAWQRQLSGTETAAGRAYWLGQFADGVPLLEMPAEFTRPALRSFRGANHHLTIGSDSAGLIRAYAEKKGVTVFMVLLTGLDVLLHRYSGQQDIVVGTPVASRDHDALEDQIGFYINLLPFRVRIEQDDSFEKLLKKVKNVTLSGYAHRQYPFDQLVGELDLDRDVSRSPLFDVLLSFDNTSIEDKDDATLGDIRVQSFPVGFSGNKYDLAFYWYEMEGGLHANIEYSTDLFTSAYIEQLAAHFSAIILEGIAPEQLPVCQIDYLSPEEHCRLLTGFNDTLVPYQRSMTIKDLFERTVNNNPEKIALWAEQRPYTYRTLNDRANRIAHWLKDRGIGKGTLAAVMADRSFDMVSAILGILKAGAAYLPLDPEYPDERIRFILNDSQAAILITDRGRTMMHTPIVLDIGATDRQMADFGTSDLPSSPDPNDLAYVIYTSGSTGQPKGVKVRHFNLSNFFTAMDRALDPFNDETLLAVTSISFDISILELFWTLCRGTQIVLNTNPRQVEGFNVFLGKQAAVNLDFSLFFFASYQDDEQDKYRLLFDAAAFADENGFSAVWTPERHFHPFGGIYPNPSIIGAAIAARTSHLSIRAGSLVLPLHDTIRVAEEWSVVDNISGGRVALSMTYGWHVDDFVFYPRNFTERKESMFRQIDELKQLWRGNTLSRKNGLEKEIDVKIYPAPIQKELPVWITSSGTPDTFKRAGEIGAGILTHVLGQDISDLESNIKVYKQALVENGFSPETARISVMMHTYLGDDLQEVRKQVKAPFKEYLRSNADLRRKIMKDLGQHPAGYDRMDELWEEVAELAFERYWQTAALLGTPDTCDRTVRQLAAIGVTEIACLIDFGVQRDLIMESLKVLNVFKERYAAPKNSSRQPPITVLQTTPSLLKSICKDPDSRLFLQSLRKLIIGGESLPNGLVQELRSLTNAMLYNVYGPTETTVWSTSCLIEPGRPVTAGKPVANTAVYVLDKYRKLVPAGIPGEIYIGGEGVAGGYLNREELTMERFICSPFSHTGNDILYRTGDIGKWTMQGELQIIGRADNQIKLRGYRIELGEIENALLMYEGISEAVVSEHRDRNGDGSIVAYCVMHEEPNIHQIRSFLLERLPQYMIPSEFIPVPQIPLTPNGKTDRKMLAGFMAGAGREMGYQAARNDIEKLFVTIWEQIFNKDNIGIRDDFFVLGGDSIKAIQMLSRLQAAAFRLDLRNIIQYPQIADLASMVRRTTRQADPGEVTGDVPLTPIQHWFFNLARKNRHHYNQAVVMSLEKDFEKDLIAAMFEKIVWHHDALRQLFSLKNGPVTSSVHPFYGHIALRYRDLRNEADPQLILHKETAMLQSQIDLEEGPLVKPGLFHLPTHSVLVIVIHHLVIDGVSWRILFEDMNSLYDQQRAGRPLTLPPKSDSCKHWAEKLLEYSTSPDLLGQRSFWASMEQRPMSRLPKDHPEGNNTGRSASRLSFHLSAGTTRLLLTSVNKAYNTEITEILLAALGSAVAEVFHCSCLPVALEGHGREDLWGDLDLSRTVGWFTSLYPVVLCIDRPKDLAGTIVAVKEELRKVPKGGIGYGVLKYLTDPAHKNDCSLSLQPEICFNYLGQFAADLSASFFTIAGDEGRMEDPDDERDFELEVTGIVVADRLECTMIYSGERYAAASMQTFMAAFRSTLENIISFCASRTDTELTPSDLTYKGLSIDTLDMIDELFR